MHVVRQLQIWLLYSSQIQIQNHPEPWKVAFAKDARDANYILGAAMQSHQKTGKKAGLMYSDNLINKPTNPRT